MIDHDTGRLVWAHPGRDKKTVYKFLDLLGDERCAADPAGVLRHGRLDHHSRRRALPQRRDVCLDPFHVIKLSTEALDEVRREVWNDARKAGQTRPRARAQRRPLRSLDEPRAAHRAPPARSSPASSRSTRTSTAPTCIAQQLRMIYRVPFEQALELLDAWLKWTRRCRLAPFVKLAKTITKQRPGIEAALRHRLSNARTEQVNTQIRLITRRGFGYHSPWAVIALAMLSLGGLCPPLPSR